MKRIGFFAAVVAAVMVSGAAFAQVVGIGTTKGGATAQVSAGIAQVVSAHAGFQMRPQPMGGSQQYIPIVNAGELEFGIANVAQTFMAYTGTGMSEGQANDNLRMVSTLMVFRAAIMVRNDSDIHSVADLRGKRLPSGYSSAPLFEFLLSGMLANGGLSYDDVQKVPVTGLVPGVNAFKEGKIDAVIAAIGAGFVNAADAAVSGGVRFIPLSTEPAMADALAEFAPKTFLLEVAPGPTGVLEPTTVMAYDYMLWAGKDVSDDVVYAVTKAMYEGEEELHGLGPLWRTHSSVGMSKDQGMPYHPGAIKYFREVGAWPGA
jgi:TRAP transporter TAXI family solute receptor